MSEREGNCPGCGAPVDFAAPGALLVVCPYCDNASYRTDVDLELIGKVAQLAPLRSVLSLGACGRYRNQDWRAVGQLQLDHGQGPWNEWCLLVDETKYLWLAEAQGEIYVTERRDDVPAPPVASVRVGDGVEIDGEKWVVSEMGEATVTGVRGSFPEAIVPGETYPYADIRGVQRKFGTIAWGGGQGGSGDDGGAVYVGVRLDVEKLGIDSNTVQAAPAPKRVLTDRMDCPKCASIVRLLDTEGTQRVVCQSCGSMFDPRSEPYTVFGKASKLKDDPRLALGAKGHLDGEDVTCLAFLQRSIRNTYGRWPWEEYLLRTSRGEYRWLVESDGHWLLARPINLAEVNANSRTARYQGAKYRHFSGGKAKLDSVLGEVYWEAKIGEKAKVDEFVAPPFSISIEETHNERLASLGRYLPAAEVRAAFGDQVKMPRGQTGVAPTQPNPHGSSSAGAKLALIFLVALLVLVAVSTRLGLENRIAASQVVDAYVGNPGPKDPHADQRVTITEPFQLGSRGNVEIRADMSKANTWVGIAGALVAVDDGQVYPFTIELERWSGPGWSEGNGRGSVLLGSIAPGRYALRLESQSSTSAAKPPKGPVQKVQARVIVTSGVPTYTRWILLLLALMVPPVIGAWRRSAFEAARWQESDHA